ncbi:MAG: hypothetical protein Q9217_006884 [Psora testacea]
MPSQTKWEPDAGVVKELAGYLRNALSAYNPVAQKQATAMLTQAKSKPETPKYLAYIFSNGQSIRSLNLSPSELTLVRSSAAINLKNIIKSTYIYLDEDTRSYIRIFVLPCLDDANPQVRSLTGTVITEVVQRGGILSWPELFPELLSIAANDRGNTSADAQEGSMSALAKLCEDRKDDLERDYQGQRPLQYIIPRLLKITASPIPKVRALAIASINAFIPQQSDILVAALDAILEQLFRLATDSSSHVRRNLCRSFVLIVDVRPDKIRPHMDGLVDYMCLQQRDTDESESALEAAEFWLAVSENQKLCASLEPYLNKIIPVLLDSMVYDEEAVMRLGGAADDAEQEDRAEDIKPHFAASRISKSFVNAQKPSKDDLSDGEIEDDDDDYELGIDDQWNLRKCSAAALDVLASKFHRLVFEIALDYLNNNLTHTEWPHREAAVLAMGAVAEGCLEAIAPALPNIVPYLTSLLIDTEPAVRVITCWALGRYSVWALNLDNPSEKRKFFEPIMGGILDRMLDKNKRVQEAAASAFANLADKAKKELMSHAERIIRTYVECFDTYKDRNIYILYDCVQTLAEQLGAALRDPVLIDLLMPAIIKRWDRVSDQSQELFPLHECLSYIASALGDSFAPFAVPTFTRCIRIVHQNLELYHLAVSNQQVEKPDKDFVVTSLDLLSAIIQALDSAKSAELVQTCQPRFFDLITYCLQDPSNDVRQSSYALLGDCAVNIFPQLNPFLPSLMPAIIQQLDVKHAKGEDSETAFSVINNACWSCGEIAMKYQQGMQPYVVDIYRKLKAIIDQHGIPVSVAENAVIAIGRLGVHCSQSLAPHLQEFVEQFLHIIELVDQTDEKAHAFLGLNCTIRQNPYVMGGCLLQYFQASLAYSKNFSDPRDQVKTIRSSFQQVLDGYKALNPDYFESLVNHMLPDQRQQLTRCYNLA